MAVDFDRVDDIAATVAALYREAELALTRRIARQLAQGLDAPGWAVSRLSAVTALRRAAVQVVTALAAAAGDLIRRAVAAGYRGGWGDELADLVEQWAPESRIGRAARAALDTVPNTRHVEALAASIVADLNEAHSSITRKTVDAFRHVIAAVAARPLTGVQSVREAAQAAWLGLVRRGLYDFPDRSGRRWRLHTYVEMATRTVTARAAIAGHTDAMLAADIELVYVSDHAQECALCRPWEHRVLRISPGPVGRITVAHELTGQPVTVEVAGTVAQARATGLHHPNCRHNLAAYFPGVTRLDPTATADPDGDRARQRQRQLERRIRAAKELEAAALDEQGRKAARARVRRAQADLRDHLAAHPFLKRQRHREQVGAGHVPPAARRDDPAGAIGSDVQTTTDDVDEPLAAPPRAIPTAAVGITRDVPDELDGQLDVLDPATRPGPLDGVALDRLLDGELFDLWEQHADDPDTADRIAAELDRRDRERGDLVDAPDPDAGADDDPLASETLAELDEDLDDQAATHAEQESRDAERAAAAEAELAIDRLVARGWSYVEAYAEVHGLDPDELARQERAAAVDVDRRAGETREQTVRRLYAEWVHLQYLAAEEGTRGHLLTHQAEARGVDPVTLFSGPAHIARANASEDLLRWWADNGGRKTYTEFRAEILGRESDRRAAEQTRLRGNDRDFGV